MTDTVKGLALGMFIAGLACMFTGLWAAWERNGRLKAELAAETLRVQWQEAVAAGQRAVNEANEAYRAREEYWRLRLQGAERERQREREASAAVLASERRAADQRVRELEAYAAGAAGGADPSADTLAACRERAGRLGGVLDEALRAHAECTGEAENLAGDVRTLLRSWPTGQQPEPVGGR